MSTSLGAPIAHCPSTRYSTRSTYAQDRVDLVRDEHDRGVAPRGVAGRSAALTAACCERSSDSKRLVAQQQFGIGDERLRDAQSLLLAARERPDRPRRRTRSAPTASIAASTRARARFGMKGSPAPVAVEAEAHQVAAPDREIAVECALLRDVTDTVRVDVEPYPPTARSEPEEHAQQRRLARTVRAEHGEELARRDVEVECLEQHTVAESHRRVAQRGDRASRRSAPAPPERLHLVQLPRLVARLAGRHRLGHADDWDAVRRREVAARARSPGSSPARCRAAPRRRDSVIRSFIAFVVPRARLVALLDRLGEAGRRPRR